MRGLTAILFAVAISVSGADTKTPRSKLQEQIRAAQAAHKRGDMRGAIETASAIVKANPNLVAAFVFRSQLHRDYKQYAREISDLNAAIKLQANSPDLHQMRGEAHFRNVNMEAAIKDWDEVIRLRPAQEPYHWQRGIAHYYAGQFEKGRKQFEIHQTVNKADVENAVFHFICNARARDLKTAQKELINIAGDRRIPMFEIHRLFAGNMTVKQVLQAADRPSEHDILNGIPLSDEARIRQEFYANYYIGLYHESHGNAKDARKFIMQAAKTADQNGYMGHCARIHAELIRRSEKTGKKQ